MLKIKPVLLLVGLIAGNAFAQGSLSVTLPYNIKTGSNASSFFMQLDSSFWDVELTKGDLLHLNVFVADRVNFTSHTDSNVLALVNQNSFTLPLSYLGGVINRVVITDIASSNSATIPFNDPLFIAGLNAHSNSTATFNLVNTPSFTTTYVVPELSTNFFLSVGLILLFCSPVQRRIFPSLYRGQSER